mmetsp:Transcript_81396/g.225407  ORF Transcript_81396/g.225407 Transcript_81396/m.225407 type:complete len:249 (-) Transcript_81396:228-974(-)
MSSAGPAMGIAWQTFTPILHGRLPTLHSEGKTSWASPTARTCAAAGPSATSSTTRLPARESRGRDGSSPPSSRACGPWPFAAASPLSSSMRTSFSQRRHPPCGRRPWCLLGSKPRDAGAGGQAGARPPLTSVRTSAQAEPGRRPQWWPRLPTEWAAARARSRSHCCMRPLAKPGSLTAACIPRGLPLPTRLTPSWCCMARILSLVAMQKLLGHQIWLPAKACAENAATAHLSCRTRLLTSSPSQRESA